MPKEQVRRLNLHIPEAMDNELTELSGELGTSKSDLTRHLLKLGLRLLQEAEKPGGGVYFREPGEEIEKVYPII